MKAGRLEFNAIQREELVEAILNWLSRQSDPETARSGVVEEALKTEQVPPDNHMEVVREALDDLLFSHTRRPHAMLGLRSEASLTAAKRRYRRLIRFYHPDRDIHRADLPEKFAALREAMQAIEGGATRAREVPDGRVDEEPVDEYPFNPRHTSILGEIRHRLGSADRWHRIVVTGLFLLITLCVVVLYAGYKADKKEAKANDRLASRIPMEARPEPFHGSIERPRPTESAMATSAIPHSAPTKPAAEEADPTAPEAESREAPQPVTTISADAEAGLASTEINPEVLASLTASATGSRPTKSGSASDPLTSDPLPSGPLTSDPLTSGPDQPGTVAPPASARNEPSPKTGGPECTSVRQVLDQFSTSYGASDIAGLMNLYHERATENELADPESIQQAYAEFFATTSNRRLRFNVLDTRPEGDACIVETQYQIRYLDQSSRPLVVSGTLLASLEPKGDGLLIRRMEYSE